MNNHHDELSRRDRARARATSKRLLHFQARLMCLAHPQLSKVSPSWLINPCSAVDFKQTLHRFLSLASMVVLLGTFCSPCMRSQNESGVRPLDSASFAANGWLKIDSTKAYRKAHPIVRNIPPLSESQPWQVNLGYIVIDSVLRTFDPTALPDTILNSTVGSDTVCRLYAEMYRLLNHNPLLLAQYGLETQLNWNHDVLAVVNNDSMMIEVGKYKSTLNELLAVLRERFDMDYLNDSSYDARFAATFSPVICRVKVISIDSTPYPEGYPGDSINTQYFYEVTGQIVDTLKGASGIPTFLIPSLSPSTTPPAICVKFDYTTNTYTRPQIAQGIGGMTVDTSFVTNGHLVLEPGDDVVAFLAYQSPRVDAQHDYFRLSICRDYSTGLLRIGSDGKLADLNSIWTSYSNISYSEWVVAFNSIVTSILTCQ